ncbi:MAG: hypothetical protein AB7T06_36495 [Kofleriaceae bacterium]
MLTTFVDDFNVLPVLGQASGLRERCREANGTQHDSATRTVDNEVCRFVLLCIDRACDVLAAALNE